MSKLNVIGTPEIHNYYDLFLEKINKSIDIAKKAKAKGMDISKDIETVPAEGIAEKTELLVGPKGVAKVYRELWEKYHDRLKVILKIQDMMLDGTLGGLTDPQEKLSQSIRTGLVIDTEGVVVSPLDGLPEIKISTNPDGTKYADIYYAGPIRAAGGSAQTLPLFLADIARKKLHLDKYKPSKKVIDRIVEEALIYQDDVVTRQQRVTEQEVRTIAENCPICINSGPDTEVEVIANRDLPEIPGNRIRGAMCLVLIDGVYVRSMKLLKTAKKLGLDWNWLEKLIKVKKTSKGKFELKPSTKYLEGLAAGRPVFSYPFVPGGFRLRYGKARNNGLMSKAVNPATMYVLDQFIAVGTHGRIERPGKSLQFFPCDSIDGPIVRLKDKSVVKIDTVKDAKKYYNNIDIILSVGDLLVAVGDFKKSGHPLIKSGYVKEEWLAEIKYLYKNEKINKQAYDVCLEFYKNPDQYSAVNLSINYNVPLFPKYIWYYDLLDSEELKILIEKLRNSEKIFENNKIVAVKLKYNNLIKNILEKIRIPHKFDSSENTVIIDSNFSYALLKAIGALNAQNPIDEFKDVLDSDKPIVEKLTEISKIIIKEKSGTYIGVRMGRPEAAHPRVMAGKPNVLFPIGHGFGNNRDIIKAIGKKSDGAKAGDYGINEVEIKTYQCPMCKKILFTPYCFDCKTEAKPLRYCETCKRQTYNEVCEVCNQETKFQVKHKLNFDNLIEKACKNINVGVPESIKGVKGLVSSDKVAEPLEKGILRARYDLQVFRDGTVRYEALNATITQFKPIELNLSIEKMRELGYTKDYLGNKLVDVNQIVSLFPQDVIIDDGAGEHFVKVAKFVDDLLVKFYGLEKYFNANTKEDLIGEQIMALAPHTSAAIVGRIIGYSKSKLGWGHPYFITAKRRNVDGDQDSMLLLMDGLLNFSQQYLSKGRGGRMDAPLTFTTVMNPFEVDDEVYEMETVTEYPYEFYINTKNFGDANDPNLKFVSDYLGTENQYSCIQFTQPTKTFDEGPRESAYLTIKSMSDKVHVQAKLQKRIVAVDNKDALERLLHYHLFPDIIGNTRAFARQKLRCVKCNTKYRRIPLAGKCTKCGGKLILTIHEGSIKKYVNIAKDVIKTYDLKPYLYQKVNLAENEINSLFVDKEALKQKGLSDFF